MAGSSLREPCDAADRRIGYFDEDDLAQAPHPSAAARH